MFDERLEVALGDRHALADLAGDVEREQRLWGCRKVVIAAAWADAHSEVDHPDGGMLVERLVRIGPAGTPPAAEFAPQGLVAPFNTTVPVGEGVDERQPWRSGTDCRSCGSAWWPAKCITGKARQIAALTADLSVATAGQVDEQTSGWVLPACRGRVFLKTLDATILQVDEQAYRQRETLGGGETGGPRHPVRRRTYGP